MCFAIEIQIVVKQWKVAIFPLTVGHNEVSNTEIGFKNAGVFYKKS